MSVSSDDLRKELEIQDSELAAKDARIAELEAALARRDALLLEAIEADDGITIDLESRIAAELGLEWNGQQWVNILLSAFTDED